MFCLRFFSIFADYVKIFADVILKLCISLTTLFLAAYIRVVKWNLKDCLSKCLKYFLYIAIFSFLILLIGGFVYQEQTF